MGWRRGVWVLLVAWAACVALAQPAWELADLWTTCLLGAWLAVALHALDRTESTSCRVAARLAVGAALAALLAAVVLRVQPAFESQRLIDAGRHLWHTGRYVDVYHLPDLPPGAVPPRAA